MMASRYVWIFGLLALLTAPSNAFVHHPPVVAPHSSVSCSFHNKKSCDLSRIGSSSRLFSERTVTAKNKDESSSRLEQEEEDLALLSLNSLQQQQRTDRINKVVLLNGVIIGAFAFSAVYHLLHTHVEALLALYDYGLGKVDNPEVTLLAVTLETIARLPVDLVGMYEGLVQSNPIFYKACTSGIAYALGDFISQVYQGKTLETVDLPRSARSGAAGFIAHGPLCHYWLLFMETFLDFGGAWWATGIKVTADLTIWAPFLNCVYTFLISALAMRPFDETWRDVKVTAWPALRSCWRFWPFVHTVSFSHAVPLDLKLLWVDAMEMVWVTILSKVANEDKNAQLEKDPETKFEQVQDEFYVDPSVGIELTRERENPGANLSFELPKKALEACWPLLVMWPVLYGGYQVEKIMGLVPSS